MPRHSLQNITANLGGGATRYETLHGRRYFVAPVAMMAPGVWAGSDGPLLYTPRHLRNSCPSWNCKPIVVNHPKHNGKPISAADPTVLNQVQIGQVLNARYENGKQRAEAWLDEELTNEFDKKLIPRVQRGVAMEVSTGLFVDQKPKVGVYHKKEYGAVASNHRPDHLAILTDEEGACSLKDGAGLGVINSRGRTDNSGVRGMKKGIRKQVKSWQGAYNKLRDRGMPHQQVMRMFQDSPDFKSGTNLMYSKSVSSALYRGHIDASATKGEDVSSGHKKKSTTNSRESEMPQTKMNKKVVVDEIIANGFFAEKDREFLLTANERQLGAILAPLIKEDEDDEEEVETNARKKMKGGKIKKATDQSTGAAPPTKKGGGVPAPKGGTGVPAICSSYDEYYANAPAEVRDILDIGRATVNTRRKELTGIILNNKGNQFPKGQLKNFQIDELEALAGLAMGAAPTLAVNDRRYAPSYAGAQGGFVANANGSDDLEDMDVPTINFKKKGAPTEGIDLDEDEADED